MQYEPKPRFLAPAARVGDGHGYVDRPEMAMRDEPECVGPAIVNAQTELAEKYNALRHAAWVAQAQEDRAKLSVPHRIADVRRRAKARHIDMAHELHVTLKMYERGNEAAARARVEGLEAQLDGPVEIP